MGSQNELSDDEMQISKKLNFLTPQKQKSYEWKMNSTAEDYARKLFDSNKKLSDHIVNNIILVMPFIQP